VTVQPGGGRALSLSVVWQVARTVETQATGALRKVHTVLIFSPRRLYLTGGPAPDKVGIRPRPFFNLMLLCITAGRGSLRKQAHRPAPAPGAPVCRREQCPAIVSRPPGKGERIMSFHSWLQQLRSVLVPGRGQRQHRRRGSLRAATASAKYLEALEDARCSAFPPRSPTPRAATPSAVAPPTSTGAAPATWRWPTPGSNNVSILLEAKATATLRAPDQ